MRKPIVLFAAAAAVAAAALPLRADVMYWQLTGTQPQYNGQTWNTVRVGYYTSPAATTPDDAADGYLSLTPTSNPDENSTSTMVGASSAANGYFAVIPSGGESAYSYFIELGNYDGSKYTAAAQSGQIAYTDIGQYTITTAQLDDILGHMSTATMQAWTGGSGFQAVPEPTGGLMVLVGLSVFALRRRKAQAAGIQSRFAAFLR